ncbi:MAG: hypothetical protein WD176_06435 [Pirellulales bacterium]
MSARPAGADPRENPFSTRRTRPGALPYLFPPGESLEGVLARLNAAGGRGEIVGPHGCGKSTLVASLAQGLTARGCKVLVLRPVGGRLPPEAKQVRKLPATAVVFIDGYEQLSRWTRARVRKTCQRLGLGLMVTAHAPCGFPLLMHVEPDLAMAKRVVSTLVADREKTVADSQVQQAFESTGGNVREMLFALYDAVERAR